MGHRNIGYVRTPYLIWPRYLQAIQQIRVDFITGRRLTGPGTPVERPQSHDLHQSTDVFPVDAMLLTLQPDSYLASSVERRRHVLLVDQFHKDEVLVRDSCRLVVQPGAADIQQLALPHHRERGTPAVN